MLGCVIFKVFPRHRLKYSVHHAITQSTFNPICKKVLYKTVGCHTYFSVIIPKFTIKYLPNYYQNELIWTKISRLVIFHAEISELLKFWLEKVSISFELSSNFQNLTSKKNFGNSKTIKTNKN